MSCGVILQGENVLKSQQKIAREKKIQCGKRELLFNQGIYSGLCASANSGEGILTYNALKLL